MVQYILFKELSMSFYNHETSAQPYPDDPNKVSFFRVLDESISTEDFDALSVEGRITWALNCKLVEPIEVAYTLATGVYTKVQSHNNWLEAAEDFFENFDEERIDSNQIRHFQELKRVVELDIRKSDYPNYDLSKVEDPENFYEWNLDKFDSKQSDQEIIEIKNLPVFRKAMEIMDQPDVDNNLHIAINYIDQNTVSPEERLKCRKLFDYYVIQTAN